MDMQKEREVFEEWVDSEFNDHNWYLESKDHRNLHQYREELNDYWQYEETLLWSAWQAAKQHEANKLGQITVTHERLQELITIAVKTVLEAKE
ncbi:MAG TPA: hypothetical protein GXX13_09625 [Acinetobacter towneri]|nr:hypothetical protein [Acinetobacter towneri]